MKQQLLSLAAVLAAVAASGLGTQAQLFSFDLPNPVLISDTDASEVTFTTSVIPALPSLESISLQLSHEWLGDLTVKVVPPSGPAFILFEQVGVTEATPEGASAILGTFGQTGTPEDPLTLTPLTYRFAATGADFGAAAQDAVDQWKPPLVSAAPTYSAKTWPSGPFDAGTWQLTITDSADLSGGEIAAAQMLETAVPEPGGTGLVCALCLLAGVLVKRLRSRAPKSVA